MSSFSFLYPAKPAVTFPLPADVEAIASQQLGASTVSALKIVFDGLGLTPETGKDILAALLQNWKAVVARVIANNGQDAINFLAATISGLPSVPVYVKQPIAALLTQFGPFIIQGILAKLS